MKRSLTRRLLMDILLDMLKDLKGTNFTIYLSILGLWNQKNIKFVENNLIGDNIIIQNLNYPHQMIYWLYFIVSIKHKLVWND